MACFVFAESMFFCLGHRHSLSGTYTLSVWDIDTLCLVSYSIDIVYFRDTEYLCPGQIISMSETESIHVRDRKYLCLRQRVFMSQTESVYVPDRECRCPRQKNIDSANTKQAITRAPDLRWR